MSELFSANIFDNKESTDTSIRMNALYLDLLSSSIQSDNQAFALKKYLSEFYSNAKDSIKSSITKLFSFKEVNLENPKYILSNMGSVPYTNLQKIAVEVPEGLNVPLLDYVNYILPLQQRANKIIENLIDPFSTYISKLISDRVFRYQAGHDIKSFINMEKEYQASINTMSMCFKKNNYKAKLPYGQAFKRNRDFLDTIDKTKELVKLVNSFPANGIVSKLNILYELLDKLTEMIDDDQLEMVDKKVTQLLSKGIYHTAKEVELAGLQTFRSKTFIVCMNTNITDLNKKIDKLK